MFFKKYKNFILLHFIVFIWGFAGILGKSISLNATSMIWYRLLIAVGVLFVYLKLIKVDFKLNIKDLIQFSLIGFLIAFHWVCFYHAIKVSNISVCLACFSSTALFTAFVEPIIYKRKLDWIEIVCGLIVLIVLGTIFTIETKYKTGMLLSISAAFIAAIFSVINGTLVRKHNSRIITFYELLTGFIWISIYLLINGDFKLEFFNVSNSDWAFLMILAVIGTAFTFVISIEIMKEISPYTINLAVNLETVYGIILAFFIFGEEEKMTPQFYLGTVIILGTIFLNAVLKSYKK